MAKNILIFIVLGLLFFSCTEEEPETFYGRYVPQSITSDTSMDITGAGVVSEDLLGQLVEKFSMGIKTSGEISLRLYTPEYFNVNFSQVLLILPYNYESANKVTVEFYQNGRRFDIEDSGKVKLSWNTNVYTQEFALPEQIHDDIIIKSIKINPRNVELLTEQRLFDHSINEWKEAKITYTFIKEY